MLAHCPKCGSENIRYGRVGTEQVVEEIQKVVPDAKVLRMDNDTTSKKGAHQDILQAFASGGYDILVGTQMIAKGHDFKNVTLVGILDADFSLYFSDYRSNERTFQLITQVSGRAGRESKAGRVLLQTYSPKHYILYYASKYDYLGFYGKEINSREVAKFPPFTKIVRVLITSPEESNAQDIARTLNNKMKAVLGKYESSFIYYKGMKSPVARVQANFRYQLLMRIVSDKADEIIGEVYKLVDDCVAKNAWVFVEIDPQNLN
jgi:primosomal protein N' (replication factor Y)